MKKLYFLVIVAVMAFAVSCKNETETTETQAKSPEEKKAIEQPQSPEMQKVRLGKELALYGYKNESAEALIEAASILSSVQLVQTDFKVKKGEAKDGAAEEETAAVQSFAPADLLAAAKNIAGEDALLLAMIQKVEDKLAEAESSERGSTNGIRTFEERVKSGTFDEYEIEFKGGETAVCAIIGNGETDLDLYICDEDMILVAEDVDYSDNCYCAWTPKETGIYIIRVFNRGTKANSYSMYIN